MPSTTNYGWVYPTDGGSSDAWGSILNTMAQAIDTDVKAVEDIATAAPPKAGGTMTGRADLLTATGTIVAKGTVSGAQSLNCALGQGFTMTINGATTLSLINVPAGLFGVVLNLVGGSAGFTHPTGTVWAAGSAPTLSAGTDILGYLTFDGGVTIIGVPIALAVA